MTYLQVLSYKKIPRPLSIADFSRDPMVYHKVDYDPFGQKSETWVVFYFRWRSPRNKLKLFESYGRTELEARTGLEKATKKKGFVEISKENFKKLKRRKKK